MRSFVLTMVATAALVLAGASQPATTAVTKTVKITATAFTPASVTIATGDADRHADDRHRRRLGRGRRADAPDHVPGALEVHDQRGCDGRRAPEGAVHAPSGSRSRPRRRGQVDGRPQGLYPAVHALP